MAVPLDPDTLQAIDDAIPQLILRQGEAITRRRMFGGICYLVNGKMLGGIVGSRLVIRVEEDEFDEAAARGEVSPMDFTGKPMRNFAYVEPVALQSPANVVAWLEVSLRYVREHMLK